MKRKTMDSRWQALGQFVAVWSSGGDLRSDLQSAAS